MNKNYLNLFMSIFLLLTFIPSNSQVGIGTTTPRGILDLNSPLTSNSGLVLPTNTTPTNISNLQGGAVAEGTMMYDSTDKCVKYFNGTGWSNCLCDSCGGAQPSVVVDCSQGFSSSYKAGVALSGATYRVTITNNSFSTTNLTFQISDLVLSGVSGVTVSSVSPTTSNIAPGASQVVTYNLAGAPVSSGTLSGAWSKINLTCNNTTPVDSMVRVAYWSTHTLGHSNLQAFNSQLQNPINYGTSGTHTGNFGGFTFTDITSTLTGLSVEQLLNNYDIISVGYRNMNIADATKIKAYVDGGGVAIISFDYNIGTNIFNAFGGIGTVTSGLSTALTNSNAINNGTFGDATNVTISASGSFGKVSTSQLAPGATVLATNNTDAQVFLMGTDDRAIFFWDEGVFRGSGVVGNIIDTPQEIALHNYISFMLRKKGY